MIQYVKPNEPKCFICKQPQEDKADEDVLAKNQNVLVYPCFCNHQAHRQCIKQWLIINKATICPTCKTPYAVGKASSSLMKNITHQHINVCLKKFFQFFCAEFLLLLLLVYIATVNVNVESIIIWKVALVVIFATIVSLVLLYSILMLTNSLKDLNTYDIEVYCSQTEIAYHQPNSQEILKGYLERMAALEEAEGENIEIEIKGHKTDTDAATNMSLLGKKKRLKEEIHHVIEEERNQTLSRILANDSENYPDNNEEEEEEKKKHEYREDRGSFEHLPKAKQLKIRHSKESVNRPGSARNQAGQRDDQASAGYIPKFKSKDNRSLTISSIQMGDLKGT